MTRIGYFRQRSHGQLVPTGTPIATLTKKILLQAVNIAAAQLFYRGHVDLSPYLTTYAEHVIECSTPIFHKGQQLRAQALLALVQDYHRKKSMYAVRKTISGPWSGGTTGISSMSYGFDVFNPYVIAKIRSSAYEFARSTLQSAADSATKAYARLRQSLEQGLSTGETQQKINQLVFGIFNDSNRAAMIGQSEAARVMNAGGLMLAQATGVTNASRWLASSDACDRCLDLNGQVRLHGEPFATNPKAKSELYRNIFYPPLHGHCFCVLTDVIAPNAQIDSAVVDRLRILAYDPSAVTGRFNRGERLAASLGERR